MAKYLAIEWDAAELRMTEGRNRGSGVVIDETYAIDLEENATPEAIGAAIKQAVGDGKNVETLIAIPRAAVEIRQMQLPAAPPDELPDMVRFQAMRQFSTIGEDWPLDYVELDRNDESVQVLASVISPEAFRDIQQVCQASDRVANHLCLRPFASAELLKQYLGDDSTCRLIVDVMSSSADLNVMVNGRIAFMRTVRMPAVADDADIPVQGLMGEIRRTIAASSNQLNGQQVSAVTLFGTGTRLEPLRSAIESQLKLDADIWSPFTEVKLSGTPPRHPGRYAALLGMTLTQAGGIRQPIDFLNPRKRPKPKSNREKYLLYTLLAVVTCVVIAGGMYMLVEQKAQKLRTLAQEKEKWKVNVTKASDLASKSEQVAMFRDESVNFVEELSNISAAMPGPRDARVQKLVGSLNNGEGMITMDVKVSGYEYISTVEEALKNEDRQVNGKRSRERADNDDFPWSFQALVTIDPIEKRNLASKMAEAEKSAADAGVGQSGDQNEGGQDVQNNDDGAKDAEGGEASDDPGTAEDADAQAGGSEAENAADSDSENKESDNKESDSAADRPSEAGDGQGSEEKDSEAGEAGPDDKGGNITSTTPPSGSLVENE